MQQKYLIKLNKAENKIEQKKQNKELKKLLVNFSLKNRSFVYKKREEMRCFVSCVDEEHKAKLEKFMKTQSNRIAKYNFHIKENEI